MMWLGIVLHASANYMSSPSPLPWRDSQTSLVADFLMAFIHSFRMPVFFILAGFFVAMLVARRGVEGMLRQRVRRLVLPFVVFWPLLLVGMSVLVSLYVNLHVTGSAGLDFSLVPHIPGKPVLGTLHLWFIYYLFLFCLTMALVVRLGRTLPAGFKEGLAAAWKTVACQWWGFIVLALPLALLGSFYRSGVVTPNSSFMPHPAEFLHSGLFFVFGCYLYQHQVSLLDRYVRNRWRYLVAGLMLFIVFLALAKRFESFQDSLLPLKVAMAFLYNCVSWLWSFALIGLFLKYLPRQNRVLTYIAASSYWVYLVHMLGTIGFGVLLFNSPFGALGRMSLNIVFTTLACLLSYQLLVRHTLIGRFLNDQRKAPVPSPDAIAAV